MKKLLAVFLCLSMLLAVGCGEDASSSAQSAPESQSASQPEDERVSAAPLDHNLLTGDYDEGAEDTRPIAIMISNEPGAYPPWGIQDARVVLEVLSEGKIPSMMCMFDNRSTLPDVGPVAPGRDVPWQLAMPSQALLVQVGSNPYTDNLLNLYHYQNLDGQHVGVTAFDFDHDRDLAGYANEFCWYTKQDLIKNGMEQYGMHRHSTEAQSLFDFGEKAEVPQGAVPADKLRISFSDEWRTRIDYQDGKYRKYLPSGDPQVEAVTGEQLTFDNCVVLCASTGVKDDGFTRDYDMTRGTGVYLTEGTYLPILWQKGRPDQPVRLFTMDGEPVKVNPGSTYLAVYGNFAGQDLSVRLDSEPVELHPLPGEMAEEEAEEQSED